MQARKSAGTSDKAMPFLCNPRVALLLLPVILGDDRIMVETG
jgi:hypothetical protein